MQYQLFVQSQSDQKFIAMVVGMPMVNGEGITENEAITRAKDSLQSQLATGKFVNIEFDSAKESSKSDFSMQYAGIFADDPTFDDWMTENNRKSRQAQRL